MDDQLFSLTTVDPVFSPYNNVLINGFKFVSEATALQQGEAGIWTGDEAELKVRIQHALQAALGDSYDCTRVWSAWGYGTMGEDDFTPVLDRNDELVDEIAAAVVGDHASTLAQSPTPDATVRDALALFVSCRLPDEAGWSISRLSYDALPAARAALAQAPAPDGEERT